MLGQFGQSRGGRVLRVAALLLALGGAASAWPGAGAVGADPTGVSKVRFGGTAAETRVVVELDRSAKAQVDGDKANPRRLTLLLPSVAVRGEQQGPGQGLVRAWTLDEAAGAARLRLELDRPAEVARRFLLPPGDGVGVYRYVLDLKPQSGASARPSVVVAAAEPAPGALRLKPVVVIDAGHGGKDPGALGLASREKDVTLAAAKTLKATLERSGRYRVVLTRDRDVFVPLPTRVELARRANAALFISLHADAGADRAMRGATVYTLSDKGTERAARAVQQRVGYARMDLPGRDPLVNAILTDLTQRATRNRSAVFAGQLLDRVSHETLLLTRSHRDAGFAVLLAPDVPAVLLEMGFITNAQDEALLTDPERRTRLMTQVARAIDDHVSGQLRLASR